MESTSVRQEQCNGLSTTDAQLESCTPRLPEDLEREIFEWAITLHWPSIVPLILVARRVRRWVEPFLYRVISVTLGQGMTNPPTLSYRCPWIGVDTFEKVDPDLVINSATIEERLGLSKREDVWFPPPEPGTPPEMVSGMNTGLLATYGSYVRHALFQNRDTADIRKILQYCPNIENLGLWMPWGKQTGCEQYLSLLQRLPLRKLSFDGVMFFHGDDTALYDPHMPPLPLNQNPFLKLTHLEIVNFTLWNVWTELAHLPRLTHLSVTGLLYPDPIISTVNHLIPSCKRLEIFVILHFVDSLAVIPSDMISRFEIDDPGRVVFLKRDFDVIRLWHNNAYGIANYWAEAERKRDAGKGLQV